MSPIIQPSFSLPQHAAIMAWSKAHLMGLRAEIVSEHEFMEEVAEVRHRHAVEPLYFLNPTTAGQVQLCAPTGPGRMFSTVELALAEVVRREKSLDGGAW